MHPRAHWDRRPSSVSVLGLRSCEASLSRRFCQFISSENQHQRTGESYARTQVNPREVVAPVRPASHDVVRWARANEHRQRTGAAGRRQSGAQGASIGWKQVRDGGDVGAVERGKRGRGCSKAGGYRCAPRLIYPQATLLPALQQTRATPA